MSVKDKKILVVFLGVVVLALAYFVGYRPMSEKKITLEAENTSLRDTYADLSMKAANADMYNKEIKVMNTKMEEIFTHFPSYLQVENEIMDAVTLEKVTGAHISSLTIADPVAVDLTQEGDSADTTESTDTASTTEEAAVDGSTDAGTDSAAVSVSAYELYDVNSAVVFNSSYKGLKDLINIIAKDAKRKSVGTVSATFDNTTGLVQGSMSYDTYFVYGQDKEYVAPVVPSMPHGTDNIFGTVE